MLTQDETRAACSVERCPAREEEASLVDTSGLTGTLAATVLGEATDGTGVPATSIIDTVETESRAALGAARAGGSQPALCIGKRLKACWKSELATGAPYGMQRLLNLHAAGVSKFCNSAFQALLG